MTKRTPPFSPEVRERAVRMVQEHQGEHSSWHAAIRSIASKIGCSGESLRNWIKEAESSKGARLGPASDERERIKALEREVPWRSSTAAHGLESLDRRAPGCSRGRADLQGAADRPIVPMVDLVRAGRDAQDLAREFEPSA